MWSFVKITEWFQRVVSQCYDCFVLFLKYSNDTIKVHKPFFFSRTILAMIGVWHVRQYATTA